MKKLFILVTVAIVAPLLVSTVTSGNDTSAAFEEHRDGITILAVGYDDVAENTDAIILINYRFFDNELSFLQIPRDTYINTSSGKGEKINSIYSSLIASGDSALSAMDKLTQFISSSLGVCVDGYVGFNTKAFTNVVDALGGINITFPYDFTYRDRTGEEQVIFQKGDRVLSGSEALRFVRYRQGYRMGDLGRVDAQKMFISAFAKEFRSEFGYKLIARLIMKGGEGLVSNLKMSHLVEIVMRKADFSDAGAYFATLPGKAVTDSDGVSYYAVNKKASVDLISNFKLNKNLPFDTELVFLNERAGSFSEVYYSQNTPYRIYNDKTVYDIVIR